MTEDIWNAMSLTIVRLSKISLINKLKGNLFLPHTYNKLNPSITKKYISFDKSYNDHENSF